MFSDEETLCGIFRRGQRLVSATLPFEQLRTDKSLSWACT